MEPSRYKLIKTLDGYRWEDLNNSPISININFCRQDPEKRARELKECFDRIDYGHIEISTWKGRFLLPNRLQTKETLCIPAEQTLAKYPIIFNYRSSCNQIYHPIIGKWVNNQHNNFTILHNDIIQWIESQPPQPDWEGVAKDRKEVEQVFMDI